MLRSGLPEHPGRKTEADEEVLPCSIKSWFPWIALRLRSVLPHAVALAQAFNAELILFHVLSSSDEPDRLRAVDPLEWQLRRAEAESYLQGVCKRLRASGVVCEAQVSAGDPAELIVSFADEQGLRLILLASHGQSGQSGWNVSSVVQKVVMRSRSSLMIVRAHAAPVPEGEALQYKRILVPLDSSAGPNPCCRWPTSGPPPETLVSPPVVQRPVMPRRTPPSQEDTELADRIVERIASRPRTISNGCACSCLRPRLRRASSWHTRWPAHSTHWSSRNAQTWCCSARMASPVKRVGPTAVWLPASWPTARVPC